MRKKKQKHVNENGRNKKNEIQRTDGKVNN